MVLATEKKDALYEIVVAIAALKNPQCHYDLFQEDALLLSVKLKELEEQFWLLTEANSDE